MPAPKSSTPKPLTDPADLLRLLGRFLATLLLYTFVIVYMIKQDMGGAVALGLFAILMQLWTVRLWRQLRDQRMAAKAEREANAIGNTQEALQ